MDEPAQQRITYLLQEIDANICAAHRSATQICATVRRHHQVLRQIHASSRVWRPLFDSFTQPPAVRRVTRTPSRFSRPLTPLSSGDDAATRREGGAADKRDDVGNMDVDMDEDYDMDESSFVSREQTFKTTTLKKLQPRSSDRRNVSADEDSLDASINSDNLPRMSRTPYMSKAAVQSTLKTQHSTSTLNSSDRDRWSPRMTSPPRTGVVSVRVNCCDYCCCCWTTIRAHCMLCVCVACGLWLVAVARANDDSERGRPSDFDAAVGH